MIRKMKVAVAQIHSRLADIDANMITHIEYIKQAKSLGIELLLFPELSLTGYQLKEKLYQLAMNMNDTRLINLSNVASDMVVVVGFVEHVNTGKYYNSMAWLRNGKVEKVHRKINLPTYGQLEEGKWFNSGCSVDPIKYDENWLCSLLICADLWDPALVHCALLNGSNLLLAPINSASNAVSEDFSNEKNWLINVQFYAMMYGIPILVANRFGNEGKSYFFGRSCIISPNGKIMAVANDEECLLSATLCLAEIEKARIELPTLRSTNHFLIHHLLEKFIKYES